MSWTDDVIYVQKGIKKFFLNKSSDYLNSHLWLKALGSSLFPQLESDKLTAISHYDRCSIATDGCYISVIPGGGIEFGDLSSQLTFKII